MWKMVSHSYDYAIWTIFISFRLPESAVFVTPLFSCAVRRIAGYYGALRFLLSRIKGDAPACDREATPGSAEERVRLVVNLLEAALALLSEQRARRICQLKMKAVSPSRHVWKVVWPALPLILKDEICLRNSMLVIYRSAQRAMI